MSTSTQDKVLSDDEILAEKFVMQATKFCIAANMDKLPTDQQEKIRSIFLENGISALSSAAAPKMFDSLGVLDDSTPDDIKRDMFFMVNVDDAKELQDLYQSRTGRGIKCMSSFSSLRSFFGEGEIAEEDVEVIKNLEEMIEVHLMSSDRYLQRETTSFMAAVYELGLQNDSLGVFRDLASLAFQSQGDYLNKVIKSQDARNAIVNYCKTYHESGGVDLHMYLTIEGVDLESKSDEDTEEKY
jgi:hypothetical protein